MWKKLTKWRISRRPTAQEPRNSARQGDKHRDGPFAELMAKLDRIPYPVPRKPVPES